MVQDKVRNSHHRFNFMIFACLTLLTFQCCGSVTQGKADSLDLSLEVPQGEDGSLFWLGVANKILTLKPQKGDQQSMAWTPGSRIAWDLREGDKLEFQGLDAEGRTVVAGEAVVGREKKATIPLRRVL